MKRLKAWLPIVVISLAVVVLLGLTMNLYGVFDRRTKTYTVPNPDNLWQEQISFAVGMHGVTLEKMEDGSYHIYGKSTQGFLVNLVDYIGFELKGGQTYTFTSGMKKDSWKTYFAYVYDVDNPDVLYTGDLVFDTDPRYVTGPFEAVEGHRYKIAFRVQYADCVIDDWFYPCLVEGTEPGDFYTTIKK